MSLPHELQVRPLNNDGRVRLYLITGRLPSLTSVLHRHVFVDGRAFRVVGMLASEWMPGEQSAFLGVEESDDSFS